MQGDERETESLLEDPAGTPGPQADQGVRQVRNTGVCSRRDGFVPRALKTLIKV